MQSRGSNNRLNSLVIRSQVSHALYVRYNGCDLCCQPTLGNSNWAHHQGWEHPEKIPNNNEEDWAARARAWASAKVAMENQHPQSQFTHIGRPEEHSHIYHDQYQHVADPRYTDTMSSHQQFPSSANPHFTPVNHLQQSTSFNSGPSHYVKLICCCSVVEPKNQHTIQCPSSGSVMPSSSTKPMPFSFFFELFLSLVHLCDLPCNLKTPRRLAILPELVEAKMLSESGDLGSSALLLINWKKDDDAYLNLVF